MWYFHFGLLIGINNVRSHRAIEYINFGTIKTISWGVYPGTNFLPSPPSHFAEYSLHTIFPFPDKQQPSFEGLRFALLNFPPFFRKLFTIKTKVDDNKHETTTIEHKASVVYECWWPVRPPQMCITN